jgi:AcrR family transcriptional regulator
MSTASPRQRLLDTAADLFYREGIGAVGVDLISGAANVSKRTLYQQFGSKEQLIAEALRARGPEILHRYVPADPDAAPPRAQILAVFAALADWSTLSGFRGCPFVNVAVELADGEHPARAVAREYKLSLRSFFQYQAERGGARNPAGLAAQLMIVFDGSITQVVTGLAADTTSATAAVTVLLDAAGLST